MARKIIVNCLSNKDIHKVLDFISLDRDKLIVNLLFETGCTVNELINIRLKHIDFLKNQIYFSQQETKSKKEKFSSISESLCSDIKKYISSQNSLNPSQIDFIFSTRQSSLMTTKRVRQILQQYGRKAGFPTKLNPQLLRYSHISHALESGISLKAIQKQTGLEKLRLMQIYDALDNESSDGGYGSFFNK